ncbi:MAG: aminotransferase class III-fold pyridoxal phosphate-dependent enzyme [candidate division NC10 bacterium]|nr:aminotransferase class III-fold pyridoxal phosphate-dependent enzyme [candidate division NC10 bacterium]
MGQTGAGPSAIEQAYRKHFAASAKLFEKAQQLIPGGITHDIRHTLPFPPYIERGRGARKWSVEGHDLIDYWVGHGALFLGHLHPAVVTAVKAQMDRGTHLGGCHPLEVRWAELVTELVPSAERVRFTQSGTEATQLALRLARAATAKEKVVKFEGHFHGWHDYATVGVKPPYKAPVSRGVPAEALEQMLLCPPNDLEAVRRVLEARRDVAAVLLEAGGGASGTIPTDPAFLKGLRELTAARGVLLIFDEVITGFRYAPGGAQEYYGVTPDLTTLAKILAGGLPGGAVAGRGDVMDLLAFRDDSTWNRHQRVAHAGTFNANPVCAVAGIATLELIADGQAQRRANQLGGALRAGLNGAAERVGADLRVYGESSCYNIFLEPGRLGVDVNGKTGRRDHTALQTYPNIPLYHALRCAVLLHGVDLPLPHGWLSAVHTEQELEQTIAAFEKALRMMQEEGCFA